MSAQCTLHNFLAYLPSFWQKLSKLVEIWQKFWQKQICAVFWDTV